MMTNISIALVDHHPITIIGLKHLFSGNEEIRIVAVGASLDDMLTISRSHALDVMIIDHILSGDTVATIASIVAQNPELKLIDFTAAPSIESAIHVLDAGAKGYVSKACGAEELVRAIITVSSGDTYVSQDFAAGVIVGLRNASVRKVALQTLKLTVREDQIVKLLLNGKTNKQIAADLRISEKTVKHYMTILMQKLNVRNRVEAVLAAQQLETENFGGPPVSRGATYPAARLC